MMNSETHITSAPTFAIVVGEHSGDTLGAGLMESLLKRFPQAKFVGIGGPKMLALGFDSLFDMEELSVMGIFEVLGRLRRLFKVKDSLVDYFTENKPDVFIGIDAPDFNLRLEKTLKEENIKTVHYVSPSVWAWRQKRIFTIEKATHMVLSLLPFEKAFYDKHQVPCAFVGHPLADDIPMVSDKLAARKALGLKSHDTILALMPGSRGGELSRLVEPFLQTALKLQAKYTDLVFIAPMISEKRAKQFAELKNKFASELNVQVVIDDTQQVMAASDCLLTASGTVTLEAALIKRPMIICYKFNFVTYLLAMWLVKLKWFSLPNLLANRELVPELLQDKVSVENILPLVEQRLYQKQDDLTQAYENIHQSLKQNASEKSAEVIINLLKNALTPSEKIIKESIKHG